jgi:hypothetical protein
MYAWVIGFRLWIQSSREGRKEGSSGQCAALHMVHALDHQCEIKAGRGLAYVVSGGDDHERSPAHDISSCARAAPSQHEPVTATATAGRHARAWCCRLATPVNSLADGALHVAVTGLPGKQTSIWHDNSSHLNAAS